MSQGGIYSPINNNKIIKRVHQNLHATEKKILLAPGPDVMKVFNKNCDKILRLPALVFDHNFINLNFSEKIVTV